MEKTFIGVRDVDEATFRRFKALAVQRNMNLGEAVTNAISLYIKEQEMKSNMKKMKRISITPIRMSQKKVRWSEEVDDILAEAASDTS